MGLANWKCPASYGMDHKRWWPSELPHPSQSIPGPIFSMLRARKKKVQSPLFLPSLQKLVDPIPVSLPVHEIGYVLARERTSDENHYDQPVTSEQKFE